MVRRSINIVKTICSILTSVVILIACERQRDLSLDPFEPNYNATVDDLEHWNFELITADDGMCVYVKKIEDNAHINFYLSFDDQCILTNGQGITFTLDTLEFNVTDDEFDDQHYENWFQSNLTEFRKDSLKVEHILSKFNGAIVSPVNRLGTSASLTFKVGRRNSNETFECVYTASPQKVKGIYIQRMWNAK